MKVFGYYIENYQTTKAATWLRSTCGTIHVRHWKEDAWGGEIWVLDVHVNEHFHITVNELTLEKAESAAAAILRATIHDTTVTLRDVP